MTRRNFLTSAASIVVAVQFACAGKNNADRSSRKRSHKKSASIDQQTCIHCGACFAVCPSKAISREINADNVRIYTIDPEMCTACGTCVSTCPSGAITLSFLKK